MNTGKKQHGGKKLDPKMKSGHKAKSEVSDQTDEMVKISKVELDDLRKQAWLIPNITIRCSEPWPIWRTSAKGWIVIGKIILIMPTGR